jgi:hypothetical protein
MILLLLNYTSRPGSESTHNNQVNRIIKIKSGKESRQSNPPTSLPKYSCTAPSGAMGRRKKDGNHSPQKK